MTPQTPPPNPFPHVWRFRTPPQADMAEIALLLTAYGCQFDPAADQLGLGQDTAAWAASADRQSIKDALEEACALEDLPLPAARPSWDELTRERKQQILDWFGESPEWATEGRLRDYGSDFARQYEAGDLDFLFFTL